MILAESRFVGNRSSLLQRIIGVYNQNFTHPMTYIGFTHTQLCVIIM